jgi:hypothetical protein
LLGSVKARSRITGIAARSVDEPSIEIAPCDLTWSDCLLGATCPGSQSITTELVATGLSKPLDLEWPMGDSRLFIVEQTGQIRIVVGGVVQAVPYFDATSFMASGTFTCLRAMAFHPDYALNGYVYIAYDTVT